MLSVGYELLNWRTYGLRFRRTNNCYFRCGRLRNSIQAIYIAFIIYMCRHLVDWHNKTFLNLFWSDQSITARTTYAPLLYQQRVNSENSCHDLFILHVEWLIFDIAPMLRSMGNTGQLSCCVSSNRWSWRGRLAMIR
ncbi:MAG: hypothetical protein JWL85_284 [Candidatus Saccharibacteria bacterium]|nr:hypothetical protein [Candidatus Saccharibacteria bacterium]